MYDVVKKLVNASSGINFGQLVSDDGGRLKLVLDFFHLVAQ